MGINYSVQKVDLTYSGFLKTEKMARIVYRKGKPRIPHLLRYQGFAVDYYSFTLGCLGSAAFSTFATLG